MGNICSRRSGGGSDEEEDSVPLSLANAASAGARKAVLDAAQKAHNGGGAPGQIVPAEAVIAGVLSIDTAQQAAADGAKEGIEERTKQLKVLSRFPSSLKEVKFAAASGARQGLKAAETLLRHEHNDIEGAGLNMISLEVAAAAAGTGAWVSCLVAAQTHLTQGPTASKYTPVLCSLLGGSMPASCSMYGLVSKSTDLVKLCAFGSLTVGVFVVSFGLIAGLFGKTEGSVKFTKIALLVAICMLLIFFSVILCVLFHSRTYRIACAVIFSGLLLIFLLVASWHMYHSC